MATTHTDHAALLDQKEAEIQNRIESMTAMIKDTTATYRAEIKKEKANLRKVKALRKDLDAIA